MIVITHIFYCMSNYIHEIIDITIENIEKKIKFVQEPSNSEDCLKTGFSSLEFHKGELCVLSSKSWMGKSAFVMSLIKQLAVENKQPIGLVVPGNFDDITLGKRLISICSGVDIGKINSGVFKPADFLKIKNTSDKLYDSPVYFFTEPNCNYSDASESIKDMVQKFHSKLIIVEGFDFFQELVDSEKQEYRNALENLIWNFRSLANELSVPIMLVIDLPDEDSDRLVEPTILDFKKYMIIPTMADQVIFVYRDYIHLTRDGCNEGKLIFAKNEHGFRSETPIKYKLTTGEFFEEKK